MDILARVSDGVKDASALVGGIGVVGGGISWLVTWAYKRKKDKIAAKCRREENTLFFEALFALVDSAKKDGKNGSITEVHRKLQDYLIRNRE